MALAARRQHTAHAGQAGIQTPWFFVAPRLIGTAAHPWQAWIEPTWLVLGQRRPRRWRRDGGRRHRLRGHAGIPREDKASPEVWMRILGAHRCLGRLERS